MATSDITSWGHGDADAEMKSWCCGMPLAEERPLTPEEVAAVRAEAMRLRRQGAGAIAGVLGVMFALSALSRTYGQGSQIVGLEVTLEFMAGIAIAGWLLLSEEGPLRRAGKLIRDVKNGAVKVFRGEVKIRDDADQAQAALIKLNALHPAMGRAQTVLVLPEAQRVWSVDGARVARWVSARWSEVAQPPAFAALAAQWLVPTGHAPEGELVSTGQRELSRAERREIERYIKRYWTRPLPAAAVLSLWLLWPVFAAIGNARVIHLSDWLAGAPTHIWAIFADIALAYGVYHAHKLSLDLREGAVQILKLTPPELVDAPDPPKILPPGKEPVDTLVEYLPVSRRLWTEDGSPTIWRRSAG
ncbi:MAG: hypothetical protein ABIY70_14990 [Capsulimonas sp.]|uniref:hypothetical protein n=1 Tax=Capsulimonas sp. TaxID=2494211 RepID=UPI003264F846